MLYKTFLSLNSSLNLRLSSCSNFEGIFIETLIIYNLQLISKILSQLLKLYCQIGFKFICKYDLSAAFDVVNIDLPLKRLRKMGMPADIPILLESWLKNQQCYVEVRSCWSQYFNSNCVTVQGSILGPVLLGLFASPLLEKEDVISYADDTYLIKGNRNKEIILQRLQFQLERVMKWLTN